jgi:plasmid stabilization system protein ParE
MRVRYSSRAIAQLKEISSFSARDDEAAAAAVLDRIERLVVLLGKFPALGRPTDKGDVRMMSVMSVPGYPYVIFYKILQMMKCASFACGIRLVGR